MFSNHINQERVRDFNLHRYELLSPNTQNGGLSIYAKYWLQLIMIKPYYDVLRLATFGAVVRTGVRKICL